MKPGNRIAWHAVWILAFLAAIYLYFSWNPPLQRAAINMVPGVLALFFLISFTGFGLPIARIVVSHEDRGTQFLSGVAFGIGLTALYVYFLGLLGLLERVYFLAWTLAGFVLFCFSILKLKPTFKPPSFNLWNTVAVAATALFLVQAIPFAVAPELTTDALEFHLLVPKAYLAIGKIEYLPRFLESNYPSLAEYNYTLILGLTNGIVCKCFHYWIGIVLLFAIGKLVKKVSPESSSAVAPAFFISMPVSAIVIGWAWNDLLFVFFNILCVLNLMNFHNETAPQKSMLLAGIMGGLASATKYTFVMVYLALLLLYLVGSLVWRWRWKYFLLFTLPIALLSSVWFFKNLVFTGNPFYPFLNEIFQSPYWNAAADQYFRGTLTKYEMPHWNWTYVFLFPFHMALKPHIVDVHVGILPLLLLPAFFVSTQSRGVAVLRAFALCYVIVWLFIRTEVRSLLTFFAVLWTIYSIGLQRLRWPGRGVQWGVACVIGIALMSNFFITIFTSYYMFDPVKYFFGRETGAAYINRLSDGQGAYDFLNRSGGVGKVMLVGMHNPYYLRYEAVFSSCCDPPVAEWISAGAKNADEIADRVRALGITHIIFNSEDYKRDHKKGLYTWPAEDRKNFDEFMARHCKALGISGGDIVYAVR